ncbi:signal peptidase I [Snuella lapsa]
MAKNKYRLIIYTVVFMFLFVTCTYWVSLYTLLLLVLYLTITRFLEKIRNKLIKKTLKGIWTFFFIFLIVIGTKLFMVDIYIIPSASMNNTLYTNDVILVNKLKYGPKLPRSPFEIPWINIAFYFNDRAKQRINEKWWIYKRLSGTINIKNGDVVVFTMFKDDMVIVKRCMGIAGDTLAIRRGDVYIGENILSPSNQILNTYEFSVNNRRVFYNKLDSIDLNIALNRTRSNHFRTTLSLQEKSELERLGDVKGLKKVTDTLTSKSEVYPNSEYNCWNRDEYGPFVVPKKGMTISLTLENYALYHKAINEHEKVSIKTKEDKYTVNGTEVTTYTFKQNYYFMMGDNRNGSMDSRVWGIVPEERIIGKVQCVLWSNYQDTFQWNRFFKKVE